jgi:hypothetical protein
MRVSRCTRNSPRTARRSACLWRKGCFAGLGLRPVCDVRVAQLLSVLGSLPLLAILAPMTLNVITVSTGLAVGLAAALLAIDLLAWRAVAAMFGRERLITGSRA